MVKSAESVDESEVIREALGGSPVAFGQIVRRYQGDIRMFVATWIRCPAATDDIAQEVFVAAYLNLEKYDEQRSLRSWLIGIAKNKTKLHLRPQTRRQNHETTLIRSQVYEWKVQELEGSLFSETDDQDLLKQCVEKLAPQSKQLVKAHYFDGQSLESIARESNRTGGSLRMMLLRIRKGLAKCVRG